MASRKMLRNARVTVKETNYNTLTINDVLCPICRSILVEPVTLPCNHGFCFSCFEGTMENANLVCPLCRVRIGSWLRKTKKEGKLINDELWKILKLKFSNQIKNKLMGIDENFDEDPEIIVSYPGEIRKEYEIQKQKEELEFRRKREADIKASEELIKKIKEEEEFQKAVIERKLKFDEEIAKKLADEFSSAIPSTSKEIINDKLGPIDKFLKKDTDPSTSQQINKKPLNFSNKEYTCRVLCLDNNDNKSTTVKELSPSVKKKMQQIQKFVDLDATSDGSDCIESEMRYFKPIDHRLNPPSQGKTPIKVTPKRARQIVSAKVSSPSGLINFHSNVLESAFARITLGAEDSHVKLAVPTITTQMKRTRSSEAVAASPSKRKAIQEKQNHIFIGRESSEQKKRQIFNGNSLDQRESPPFYGFENVDAKPSIEQPSKLPVNNIVQINGATCKAFDDDNKELLAKKILQEQADLEFARKLQEEFNRSAYKRSTRRSSVVSSSRQPTLDEIISPYKVK